jgi:hypothetical protein
VSLAALAGVPVTRLLCQVPDWGCWWADVDLSEPEELSGAVVLKLADKTLNGTIVSGGAANGTAGYRLVGGAGGWGREIPAKPYLNDAGVKASDRHAAHDSPGFSLHSRRGARFARAPPPRAACMARRL